MKIHKYTILLILFTCTVLTCCNNKGASFPGYVQGKFTYISAYYTGILKKISVNPGDFIKKGQPLFTLEPYPENTDLIAANAQVQQAIHEKNKHDANYELQKSINLRNTQLFKKNVISKEEFDKSMEDFRVALDSKNAAEAFLAGEQANLSKAAWALQQKTVVAPMDALVFDTYYSEYEKIAVDKPVLSLLKPGSIKVIFFIPEELMKALKLNQLVDLHFDGSSQAIKAKVIYISPKEEFTPPVIYSEDERKKLVFRVEALPIQAANNLNLHPGQPITVMLNMDND